MILREKSSPSLNSLQTRRDEKPVYGCLMSNYKELGR